MLRESGKIRSAMQNSNIFDLQARLNFDYRDSDPP